MGRQLNLFQGTNIDLKSVITKAQEDWEDSTPYIKEAYSVLMDNEAFWAYPEHYSFSRVLGWTVLGTA
jgi:hypothetical protein